MLNDTVPRYSSRYDTAIALRDDIVARERIEEQEYDRTLNKSRFRKYKRNLKLHERIEHVRDDDLADIIKRSAR